MPPEVIWSFGEPEEIGAGFAAPFTRVRDAKEAFTVGVDDPDRDWDPFLPGPLDGYGGFREHTREVRFTVASLDHPAYRLRINLYVPGVAPQLRVDVNGRTGRYLVDPPREDRSRVLFPPSPVAGEQRIEVWLPSDALRAGENLLRLTTTGEAGAPVPGRVAGYRRRSGLLLCGIALDGLPDAEAPEPTVTLTPLPLFREDDDGLTELVDLVVTAPQGFSTGGADVHIDGAQVQVPLDPGDDAFGQVWQRFAVPEPGSAVTAKVQVTLDERVLDEEVTFEPARKWTVHVLPHVHLDIGYTDHQGKVFELHSRNIDRALDRLDDHPDYRYSIDGSLSVTEFLASRSSEQRERLLTALREGTLSVNAFTALFLTGLATLEECYRAAYPAEGLRRDHGVPITYANLTDVPSYSFAVPSMLAAMGIDAFIGIENHGKAANADSDLQHLVSPCWWEGPDGSRVLTYFSDCYLQVLQLFGDPPTIPGVADGLIRFLRRYERDDYAPDAIPIVGSQSDNEDLDPIEQEVLERWNERYAYPRFVTSTFAEYLEAVEAFADELPTWQGDGGSYWEDGVGADARTIATYRRAQMLLPAAETLFALTAAVDPRLEPPLTELDAGWSSVFYGSEHTWTYMHSMTTPHAEQTLEQLDWKRHQVWTARRVAIDTSKRAMSQLGELVTTSGSTFVVFNPLSWERSGDVEVEVGPSIGVEGAGEVEASEQADGLVRARFRATDVPAFGFHLYPLKFEDRELSPPPLEPVTEPVRSGPWTVTVSDGRITSLVHERFGELVDADSPFALGELLYVAGGGTAVGRGVRGERTALTDTDWFLPPADLDIVGATVDTHGVRRVPDGIAIELAGSAPTIPEVTERILLTDDRIEVRLRFRKEPEFAKEAVYVAFPFAMNEPRLHYDRQQGWVDPAADHAPGACNEWFCVQHAVALSDDDRCVVWSSADAPLFCVGDVMRGTYPRTFTPHGTLLSWVMNNYWWTNYPASQSGQIELRYAFTVAEAFDPAAAARFGREVRTPLVVEAVGPFDKADDRPRPLGAVARSLFDVTLSDNVVATVYPARHASGMIVRLAETAGADGTASIPCRKAWLATALERDVLDLPVTGGRAEVAVRPNEVVTVRCEVDA